LSAHCLREISERGGFDEYILTVPDHLIECEIAQMYKRKIKEVYDGKSSSFSRLRRLQLGFKNTLADRYGEEYAKYVFIFILTFL
jgi:hypothetical protein